jgi:hypothetical protein
MAALDNEVFCEELPPLIPPPVASLRSVRCGCSGAPSVAVVEAEWGASVENIGAGIIAGGCGLEEIRIR